MRASFVGGLVASATLVAFGWVAGCTSNVRPPLIGNDSIDASELVDGAIVTTPVGPGSPLKGGDASDDAATVCIPAASGGCNTVGLCGEKIYVVGSAGTLTPGTGGTFAPGTYDLVAATAFGVSGLPVGVSTTYWFQQTIVIEPPSDDAGDAATQDAGDGGAVQTAVQVQEASLTYEGAGLSNIGGALVPSGTSFSILYTCGAGATTTGNYTASATSFVLNTDQSGGGTLSTVYQREP